MSADEGFCLPAWGTFTHTTNRLHGDPLIIAYTIRDPRRPVCMTHFATLSESIIATPAYGSRTGAASPVTKRLFGRKLPLSCVSVSARMSYSNWVHSSRCVKKSPPQFHVASFNFAPTRMFLLCVMALRYRPLSRRLDRCDRVIHNESGDPNGGNMCSFSGATCTSRDVTMQITFLTRKSALIYRRDLRQRVASLTLNCNGVLAIRAYYA